jgi:hypothetical protein
MSDSDKYISGLTPKTSSDISGLWNLVIAEPEGQANSTYRIIVTELINWIIANTDYTEVYDLPVSSDDEDTVINVGGGSPWTEVARFRASNSALGVGTTIPTSKVEIYSSDPTNGDLMINPLSGDKMGIYVEASDDSSSPTTPSYLHIGRKIFGEDATFVKLLSLAEDGNIELNANDSNVSTTISGYTQLGGSSAPEIKMKKFTGTVGSFAGSEESFAHGVSQDKIISCSVLVKNSLISSWIPPNDTTTANSYYTYRIGSSNIIITVGNLSDNSPDMSSSAIESQNYVCTIMYEK